MSNKTVEFKPEVVTATTETVEQNLKEQFKEGTEPQQQRQPTQAEIEDYRDKEMKRMKVELPYMRMKDEYNRLEISLYEQGVALGAISITNKDGQIIVPGLLGIELFLKQQEILSQYANYKDQLRQRAQEILKQQEQAKEQPTDTTATAE